MYQPDIDNDNNHASTTSKKDWLSHRFKCYLSAEILMCWSVLICVQHAEHWRQKQSEPKEDSVGRQKTDVFWLTSYAEGDTSGWLTNNDTPVSTDHSCWTSAAGLARAGRWWRFLHLMLSLYLLLTLNVFACSPLLLPLLFLLPLFSPLLPIFSSSSVLYYVLVLHKLDDPGNVLIYAHFNFF